MRALLSFVGSHLPAFLSALILLGLSLMASGCYTLSQGAIMLGYLNRAIPLEDLAARPDASDEDRLFVQRVQDIRRFAFEELGLEPSRNYTRYVALDRDYLAAVVSASAKDSFTRHQWWFPVVGRVPYKGYFNIEGARRERERLEKRDLDVWIRGVNAFSTLGWFRDPLYSFMQNYSEEYLADLIIHELFHATLWLNNHSQFNEELAQFVGTQGARLYMEEGRRAGLGSGAGQGPGLEIVSSEDLAQDAAVYQAFLRELIAELETMYALDIGREEKLLRKDSIIEAAKERFVKTYDEKFITDTYRGFRDLPVNNAYLDLFRLYYEGDPYYEHLFLRSGSDLRAFIAAAKTLQGRGDPRRELEIALGLDN